METLLFITDRYPYGISEAFIENEVEFLSKRFDRVIILPSALCVNPINPRKVPDNFLVLPPANKDDLYYGGRPSKWKRITWSIKNILPWTLKSLVSKLFWSEICDLISSNSFNYSKLKALIRTVAPIERNVYHFRNKLSNHITENDAIYVYSYWLNPMLLTIDKLLPQHRPVKIIARAHGYDLYEKRRSALYIPLKKQTIDASDVVSAISAEGQQYLMKQFNDISVKFKLSRLGTRNYGICLYSRSNSFRILSCSSLIPVKRVNILIDCLSMIDDIKLSWVHIGAGEDFEQTKKYAYSRLRNKTNIDYLFKGQMQNSEIMDYYKSNCFDVFVNVSESEGLPVSIMEALSFGTPIIATNVGGTSEAVIDGVNGRLLSQNFDSDEFYSVLRLFVDMDEEESRKMRLNARKHWENNFFADRNYSDFVHENF